MSRIPEVISSHIYSGSAISHRAENRLLSLSWKSSFAPVDSRSRSYFGRRGFGEGHEKLILALVRTIL